jgi:hypothetical protein
VYTPKTLAVGKILKPIMMACDEPLAAALVVDEMPVYDWLDDEPSNVVVEFPLTVATPDPRTDVP